MTRPAPVPVKRPDMRAYFRSRIAWHAHGLLSGPQAPWPDGVRKVEGDVRDPQVVVTMDDGTVYRWSAGRLSSRKRHGCYAPLMPRPLP